MARNKGCTQLQTVDAHFAIVWQRLHHWGSFPLAASNSGDQEVADHLLEAFEGLFLTDI